MRKPRTDFSLDRVLETTRPIKRVGFLCTVGSLETPFLNRRLLAASVAFAGTTTVAEDLVEGDSCLFGLAARVGLLAPLLGAPTSAHCKVASWICDT